MEALKNIIENTEKEITRIQYIRGAAETVREPSCYMDFRSDRTRDVRLGSAYLSEDERKRIAGVFTEIANERVAILKPTQEKLKCLEELLTK